MQFVSDESVHGQIIRALRNSGLSVRSITETDRGAGDDAVLAIAHSHNSILITEDKDFGELVFAGGSKHSGVILLRLELLPIHDQIARLLMTISAHSSEIQGAFTVIDPYRIRIRTF